MILPGLLKDSHIIGIGQGQTIFETSLCLPFTPSPSPKTFIPLVGDSGNNYSYLQTSSIVNRFAIQFQSNGFYINSPALTTAESTPFQEATFHQLHQYWDEMDTAVLTVGNCSHTVVSYKGEDVPLAFLLQTPDILQQAKGEMFVRPYSAEGEIIVPKMNDSSYRFVAIPLQKLKEIKNVICIACSAEKIQPLIAAAQLGYYKTLVIDQYTAEEMLRQFP